MQLRSWVLAKSRRARPGRARFPRLEGGDVGRLEALGTPGHLEFDSLPLVQRLVSVRLNRGEMDENVLAGLALDESKAFAGVKPLHGSLFFQLCLSFRFELFAAVSHRLQPIKKGRKCGLAAPSGILKVLQEQQTRRYSLTPRRLCPVKMKVLDSCSPPPVTHELTSFEELPPDVVF